MRGHDYMSEIAGELWVDNPDIPVTSAEQVKDYNQVDPTTNKPKTIEQLNTEFKTAIQALENATGNTTLVSRVNNLWNILGTEEDVDNVINKFNEVVAFLDGIEETDRLNSLLDAIRILINAKASKSELYVEQGYGANADKVTIILGEGIGKSATVLKEHQDISGKANTADLATVATSGDYNDLTNKPTIPSLNGYATKAWVGEQGFLTAHQDISGKVDKVTGKGLSTNDYTTEEKTKLGALPTNSDLQTALSGKQDTISDLSTIRSGAAAGATAVQPADIAALDATESGTSTDGKVSVEVTETDGVVTGVEVTTNDIASASALSAEVARAQGVEANKANAADVYTKQEVNGLVSTPHQNYVTVADYASLPSSGQATDTIYRVSNYDDTQVDTTKYAEYAWNGTQYVLLSVKSAVGEVFDISDYNSSSIYNSLSEALGTNGANVPVNNRKGGMSIKFIKRLNYDLYSVTVETDTNNAQLDGWSTATTIEHELVDGTDLVAEAIVANLDTTVTNDHSEKGDVLAAIQALNLNGTAKFAYTLIDTVEGGGDIPLQRTYYYLYTVTKTTNEATEYVQYRLMSTVWSIATSDWQGVDDEPTAESENLVKSGGAYNINTIIYKERTAINNMYMLFTAINGVDYIDVEVEIPENIANIYIALATGTEVSRITTVIYTGSLTAGKHYYHVPYNVETYIRFYDAVNASYPIGSYFTLRLPNVIERLWGESLENLGLPMSIDDIPVEESDNFVKSGGVYSAIEKSVYGDILVFGQHTFEGTSNWVNSINISANETLYVKINSPQPINIIFKVSESSHRTVATITDTLWHKVVVPTDLFTQVLYFSYTGSETFTMSGIVSRNSFKADTDVRLDELEEGLENAEGNIESIESKINFTEEMIGEGIGSSTFSLNYIYCPNKSVAENGYINKINFMAGAACDLDVFVGSLDQLYLFNPRVKYTFAVSQGENTIDVSSEKIAVYAGEYIAFKPSVGGVFFNNTTSGSPLSENSFLYSLNANNLYQLQVYGAQKIFKIHFYATVISDTFIKMELENIELSESVEMLSNSLVSVRQDINIFSDSAGNKYRAVVANGSIVPVPLSVHHALIIGNSFTDHPTVDDTLAGLTTSLWWGHWSMAASSQNTAWTKLLQNDLRQKDNTAIVTPIFGRMYEMGTVALTDDRAFIYWENGTLKYLKQNLEDFSDVDCVVFFLGDNYTGNDWETVYTAMINQFVTWFPSAMNVFVGTVQNASVNTVIQNIANTRGVPFISVFGMKNTPKFRSVLGNFVFGDDGNLHQINNSSVGNHFGDFGQYELLSRIAPSIGCNVVTQYYVVTLNSNLITVNQNNYLEGSVVSVFDNTEEGVSGITVSSGGSSISVTDHGVTNYGRIFTFIMPSDNVNISVL